MAVLFLPSISEVKIVYITKALYNAAPGHLYLTAWKPSDRGCF